MSESLIGQVVGASSLMAMASIILWFLWGVQKDNREINKDWYKRHNM